MPNSSELRSADPIVLRNQDDRSIEFRSLAGRVLIVSFIYTRCPSPTMCPLITRKFIRAQRELLDVRDRVRLLLVTLDPEYDTPKVLRQYGEVSGVDFTNLWFLTGERESLERLEQSFQVYKKEEQPGVYAHTTDVFLVDETGIVKKVFPGAFWDVDDLVDAVLELLGASKISNANRSSKVEQAEQEYRERN